MCSCIQLYTFKFLFHLQLSGSSSEDFNQELQTVSTYLHIIFSLFQTCTTNPRFNVNKILFCKDALNSSQVTVKNVKCNKKKIYIYIHFL